MPTPVTTLSAVPTGHLPLPVRMRLPPVFFALLCLLLPLIGQTTEIGLQFFVDSADTAHGVDGTRPRLERMVQTLNGYFRDSGVALVASLRHIQGIRLGNPDALQVLEDMHRGRGAFSSLPALSDAYGADFNIAIVPNLSLHGRALCGRGYAVNTSEAQLRDRTRAMAVMRLGCGANTLAHELGHLMGLNHGHLVDHCQPGHGHTHAIAPYANGFGVGNCDGKPQAGEFGTIMVGGWMRTVSGERSNRLEVFSNPALLDARCGRAGRCGDVETGNAAAALNRYAALYAAHDAPDVDTLDYRDEALRRCLAERFRGMEIDELHELSCPGRGITELAGIGALSALQRIDLSGNALHNLTPLLQALPEGLQHIDLQGNPALKCEALHRLQALAPQVKIGYPARCLKHESRH